VTKFADCIWHIDQAAADEYRASIWYSLHAKTHGHANGRCCCGKPHRDRRGDPLEVVVVRHATRNEYSTAEGSE
jgi:hypothetical protein